MTTKISQTRAFFGGVFIVVGAIAFLCWIISLFCGHFYMDYFTVSLPVGLAMADRKNTSRNVVKQALIILGCFAILNMLVFWARGGVLIDLTVVCLPFGLAMEKSKTAAISPTAS